MAGVRHVSAGGRCDRCPHVLSLGPLHVNGLLQDTNRSYLIHHFTMLTRIHASITQTPVRRHGGQAFVNQADAGLGPAAASAATSFRA